MKIDWDIKKNCGRLTGDNFSEVREYFSVKNEAAFWAKKRGWFAPERKYNINPEGLFDFGMFENIKSYMGGFLWGREIEITNEFQSHYNTEKFKNAPIAPLNTSLRDYQEDCVRTCLDNGKGVVLVATAGGKTVIFSSLLNSIHQVNPRFKCLIIVPNLGLVEQTYKEFIDKQVKFSYTRWTGNHELNLVPNVIIANVGILHSECSDTSWIRNIDVLIVDEVHQNKSKSELNKLIKKINTPYRFGFTGTLPDDPFEQWNIIGKFGPVIYEKRSVELRDEKFISDVKALILEIAYLDKPEPPERTESGELISPTDKYQKEIEFLVRNEFRNRTIGKICNSLPNNSLLLVDYIEHGEILLEAISSVCPNKQVYFIQGNVEVEERDRIKQIMEKNDNVICIAISKIFSTGISINNIHYIIFCGLGKAKIKILQSIGRGLRLHENKKRLLIIDICDMQQYSAEHSANRIELYNNEKIPYERKRIQQKIGN